MEIYLADYSGFCYGVENAIKIAKNVIDREKNVYSLGPLIHNEQVIDSLKSKGLSIIQDINDINDSKLIVRSHGVPLEVYDNAKKHNLEIIDTTCPFVRKIQNKVKEYHKLGYKIIIIGNSSHPEVIGINGWCENKAFIINNKEDINTLPEIDKMCVVSQTTSTIDKFEEIITEIKGKYLNSQIEIFNTICNATRLRQDACFKLSKSVDAMIVIGGFHSSNTQKLVHISKTNCDKTYHIETFMDLNIKELKNIHKIGITAGASTPDFIIEEVINNLKAI